MCCERTRQREARDETAAIKLDTFAEIDHSTWKKINAGQSISRNLTVFSCVPRTSETLIFIFLTSCGRGLEFRFVEISWRIQENLRPLLPTRSNSTLFSFVI